ncbi:MAG: tetratricopeptide repeat protein [Ammonifex sp.]|nr:MAG: tetratricopeptide repeat protein [Ammonifex sp.]
MKLSLCMIVKNEEEYLSRCLKSVQGVVGEVVVVDTGSTDRTVEIAKSFGARVHHFPWTGDFSAARNVSLEKATGDWIIFLDADEELVEEDGPKLREIIASGGADGYYLTEINFVGDRPGIDAVINTAFRVFRNRTEHRFTGAIHEQIVACVQKHGGRIAFSEVRINHYGYLNQTSLSKNKIQRNLEILKKEVQKRPKDNFTRFNLGVEYLRLANYQDALKEFQKAFHKIPTLEIAYVSVLLRNIVLCLKELKRYDEALSVLKDAVEGYPDYTDLVFLKAGVYADMKDLSAAVATYRECLSRGESNTRHITQQGVGSYRAWYGLGQAYEQLGDYVEAVRAYTEALKSNRYFLGPVFNLTGILVPREDIRAVKEFFARYLDLSDVDTLIILGQVFTLEKRYQEALEYIEAALRLDGPSQRLLFQKGEILLNLRRYTEAGACFERLENGAHHVPALLSRAFCLLMRGHYAEAVKLLDPLVGEESISLYVRIYRDFAALLTGSAPVFLPALAKKEMLCEEIIFDLLGKLLELREFEKFARALTLAGISPEPERRLKLGKLYFKYGFKDSAAEELLAAFKSGAQDAEALAILGEIGLEEGFNEEAVIFYRHALDLDKGCFRYYTALASVLCRLQRYQEAQEVIEEGLRRFPASSLLKAALKGTEVAVNFQQKGVVGYGH